MMHGKHFFSGNIQVLSDAAAGVLFIYSALAEVPGVAVGLVSPAASSWIWRVGWREGMGREGKGHPMSPHIAVTAMLLTGTGTWCARLAPSTPLLGVMPGKKSRTCFYSCFMYIDICYIFIDYTIYKCKKKL